MRTPSPGDTGNSVARMVFTVLIKHTLMPLRLNPASGIPLYIQLLEQIKHSIETGAIRAGEQLPSVRQMAEELLINPNTVARAYRELEHEGVLELRHGAGAFIRESAGGPARLLRNAHSLVRGAIERLA